MSQTARPSLTLKRKLLFACISFLLFLLVVEGVARLWELRGRTDRIGFRQLFQRDARLMWRIRPYADFHGLIVNAQGHRGVDFTRDKPPGATRIACVGDSCTFGGSYRPGADYPAQLEAALNRSAGDGRRFQVYNFSGHGYSSHQGRILFEEALLYRPDVAIVYFGPNDYLFASHLSDASAPVLPTWFVRMDNFLWHSAGYRLLVSRSREWPVRALPPGADETNFREYLPRRVSSEEYRENLAAMARRAKEEGVRLIFLDISLRPEIPLMLNQIPIYDATSRVVHWYAARPEEGSKTDRLPAGEAIALGRLDEVEPDELERMLSACPDFAAGYYARAWLSERAGRIADASADFARAADLDFDRRVIEEYRRALRAVGQEFGAPVLSPAEWMPAGREAWRYFHDERHLTEEGDRKLGEWLAAKLDGMEFETGLRDGRD
ncbi:hypothetical protein HS125_17495 [bacterium]|nr:hypothetical protein [bacterium]